MRSIMPINQESECSLCHRTDLRLEEHHIFGGSNRKWSEKFGLKINICRYCHMELHSNRRKAEDLMDMAKEVFLETHSLEDFKNIFGKYDFRRV